MEETVYREWDYLRGVKEGWIPKLIRGVTVEQQTGTDCAQLEEEALACTTEVVDPFPKDSPLEGDSLCRAPVEDASLFLLKAFACVGVVAVVLFRALRAAALRLREGPGRAARVLRPRRVPRNGAAEGIYEDQRRAVLLRHEQPDQRVR